MRNILQLDVMQRLNYEGHAISFWGLQGTISFVEAGPLRGHVDLVLNQKKLDDKFEECLQSFASSAWVVWPSNTDSAGLRYKLTDQEKKMLLASTTVDK